MKEVLVNESRLKTLVDKLKNAFAPKSHTHTSDDITGLPTCVVDDELSETSTNPVENKVVTKAIENVNTKADEANTRANEAYDNAYYAQQRADEAYGKAEDANNNVYYAQQRADEAYGKAEDANNNVYYAQQRADEAYNYAMGIVVPPDYSSEIQQAQSAADNAYYRADEAYNRADEAYYKADGVTTDVATAQQTAEAAQQKAQEAYNLAVDGGGCLTEMIYLMLLPLMLVRIIVYNSRRFFFTMPLGNSDGTPIGDLFFYYIYLVQKGRKDELPSKITEDVQLLMYGDRKCNICIDDQMTTFLPTLDVRGISCANSNLDIVFTDEVTNLFAQYFGIPDIVALRIVDPVQIEGEDCYWALVMKDGSVLNPGEYEFTSNVTE